MVAVTLSLIFPIVDGISGKETVVPWLESAYKEDVKRTSVIEYQTMKNNNGAEFISFVHIRLIINFLDRFIRCFRTRFVVLFQSGI